MIAPSNPSEPPQRDRSKAIANRDAWNETYSPGTFVRVWQSLPKGDWFVARTNGPAFIHGNGAAVHVRMACAPIYLTNLEPLTNEAITILTHDTSIEDVNRELRSALAASRPSRQVVMVQLPPSDR